MRQTENEERGKGLSVVGWTGAEERGQARAEHDECHEQQHELRAPEDEPLLRPAGPKQFFRRLEFGQDDFVRIVPVGRHGSGTARFNERGLVWHNYTLFPFETLVYDLLIRLLPALFGLAKRILPHYRNTGAPS